MHLQRASESSRDSQSSPGLAQSFGNEKNAAVDGSRRRHGRKKKHRTFVSLFFYKRARAQQVPATHRPPSLRTRARGAQCATGTRRDAQREGKSSTKKVVLPPAAGLFLLTFSSLPSLEDSPPPPFPKSKNRFFVSSSSHRQAEYFAPLARVSACRPWQLFVSKSFEGKREKPCRRPRPFRHLPTRAKEQWRRQFRRRRRRRRQTEQR